MLNTRRLLFGAAAALLSSLSANNHAADYAARPVHLLVGLPPGGSTDLAARIYADKLRTLLGQAVVVENRPGANTQISLTTLAQAEPDGYTLLFGGNGLSTLPIVSKTYTLDAGRDVAPVSIIVSGLNAIGVQPGAPYHSIDEFIGYLKAHPGKLNYANISSPDLLALTLFQNALGVQFETVRYNGAAPAAQAVVGGQADFYTATIGSITKGFVDSGKVRLLAVMSTNRSKIMPEVPSFGESAIPAARELGKFSGFGQFWFGLVAPGKTPRPIVDVLHEDSKKIVNDGDFAKRVGELGLEPVGSTPEEFARQIREETTRFMEVAKQANIQPQ